MFGSKYDSGAEKRKRKRTHYDFMKSQQGSISKHFKRSTADEDLEEERVVIETANVQVMNVGSAMESSADDTLSNESPSVYVLDKVPSLAPTSSTFHSTLGSQDGEMQQIELTDIGCWPPTNKLANCFVHCCKGSDKNNGLRFSR